MKSLTRVHIPVLLCVFAGAAPMAGQGRSADAGRSQQIQSASEFVTLRLGAEAGATKHQSDVLKDLQPTLDVMRTTGATACATAIQDKLTTPLFIRDEVAKALAVRPDADVLGRVLVLTRATNGPPSEAAALAALNQAYPDASDLPDAMRMAKRDMDAANAAFAISMTDAAQVRQHYCKGMPGGADAGTEPPKSLAVSCDNPEYQVLSIAPPLAGDTAWRVRYRRGIVTGTWEAKPLSRGFTIGTTRCDFDWQ